jgi:hypothetical protein
MFVLQQLELSFMDAVVKVMPPLTFNSDVGGLYSRKEIGESDYIFNPYLLWKFGITFQQLYFFIDKYNKNSPLMSYIKNLENIFKAAFEKNINSISITSFSLDRGVLKRD